MQVVQVLYDNLPAAADHCPDRRFRDGWVMDRSCFVRVFTTTDVPFPIDPPEGLNLGDFFLQYRLLPGEFAGPAVGWGRPAVIYYDPHYPRGVVPLGDPDAANMLYRNYHL